MGETVKLCNQVAGMGTLMAVCEAMMLGAKSGADLNAVIEALSGGAARSWMIENLAPRMAKRDFAPGFMVRLAQKDLRLAQALATEVGAPLAGAGLAQQLYRAVEAHGVDRRRGRLRAGTAGAGRARARAWRHGVGVSGASDAHDRAPGL
jgi:3-hydroxyisobutyrate dehydrogenase-like beta-hydroxyacid dehydrogenase